MLSNYRPLIHPSDKQLVKCTLQSNCSGERPSSPENYCDKTTSDEFPFSTPRWEDETPSSPTFLSRTKVFGRNAKYLPILTDKGALPYFLFVTAERMWVNDKNSFKVLFIYVQLLDTMIRCKTIPSLLPITKKCGHFGRRCRSFYKQQPQRSFAKIAGLAINNSLAISNLTPQTNPTTVTETARRSTIHGKW